MEIENLLQIPETWVLASLKTLAKDIYRYPTFYGMEHLKQGVPVIRGEHINDDGTISQDWSNYWFITHDLSQQFPRTILEPDDLVMSVRGTIGKIGLVNQKLNNAQISPNCLKIALYQNYCLPKFFLFYLKSVSGQRNINLVTNSTTINTIKASSLSETLIPLPPLNEQRRIVTKIEALKARSQKAKEALETIPPLLDQFRQSVLAAAFRGDLTADWREKNPDVEPASVLLERIREKRLAQANTETQKQKLSEIYLYQEEEDLNVVPCNWIYITLEKICESFQYGTSTKSLPSGQVPVLRMGNLQKGEIDWTDLVYTSDAEEIEKYRLEPGDVLFNRTNSPELVGKTSIYRGELPAIFAGYLIKINNCEELDSEYLNYCLNTSYAKNYCWKVKTDGVSQSNINAQKLGKFQIPFCSVEEQREIVHSIKFLLKAATQIEQQYQQAKAYLDQLDQSILAKAFRGELVPQDPKDEPASVLLERIQAERATREAEAKTAKKSMGKTPGQRSRKAKQQDSESTQLGLPGLE